MPAETSLLEESPLFSLLDDAERRVLAELLEEERVREGNTIFASGDPGDCLYLVHSGRVEIFVKDPTGERITFSIADKGDLFGELAAFESGPRTTNAYALENCILFKLNRAALHHFILRKPDAALDLMATMAKRIRSSEEVLLGGTRQNPNIEIEQELKWVQRVANKIAEFSGSMSSVVVHVALFVTWIVINLGYVPGIAPFDPYPFGLLTMAVSLEAIFLSVFVLLAQNLQAAKDKIRADIEYQVNLRAELEIQQLHEKFDAMNARILERLHRIERPASSSYSL
jgi:CRP/FNR family cyclic AMP-dependent transcriptional regulator